MDYIENDASNISIVALVFVDAGTCLLSRCLVVTEWDAQTHRQQADLLSILLFLFSK